jgi:large subunit ribosomal protein L25
VSESRLKAEPRTEFGKGASRRARRSGKIPAVLYGHGADPQHLELPAVEFARVIRDNGRNAVLSVLVDGAKPQLALTKTITVHPLKNYIEHVDLLTLKRGEKVTVDVPITLTGDPVNGTLVNQDLDVLSIEVDALHIPEQLEVSLEGAEIGHHVLAAQVELPEGAELLTDPEYLVVAVNEAPTAEALEEEGAEVAAEEEAEEGAEAAAEEGEGERAEAESE